MPLLIPEIIKTDFISIYQHIKDHPNRLSEGQ